MVAVVVVVVLIIPPVDVVIQTLDEKEQAMKTTESKNIMYAEARERSKKEPCLHTQCHSECKDQRREGRNERTIIDG